ncbi:MAG: hypothetical protein SFV81_19140 [Pirellulaceae bacterium]|nr:hypothetical protein [Pirellulaceae bacterium]
MRKTEVLEAAQSYPSPQETSPAPRAAPQPEPFAAEVKVIPRQLDTSAANASTNSMDRGGLLDSRSIACRAANEWLPAKQLRQHAHAVQQLYCEEDDCTREAANAIARFLHLQADHQQDLAAAIALRAYYALAAIEEQTVLLKQSDAELQQQRERQAALQQKGQAAAMDLTSLDREAIALNLQRIQLQQRGRQLREALNDATHTHYDWDSSTIEPLEVREQVLDTEYLQRFAQAHRHDLLALQCLSSQINSGTAPMLSSVVNSATGLASLPLPKRCFLDRVLGREDNTVLTNNLKQSMALACETQSSTIRHEVSEKAIALELAYQRIALAKETTASWTKRRDQLERLAELGDSRPAELVLANSSLLSSTALEVERRLEAKLAEIALAEACGELSQRCCQGQAWLVTSPSR